jgi:radical SAM protein with 4Fe4S-binding SPASM domain
MDEIYFRYRYCRIKRPWRDSMKIKHSGNFQSIVSARCAMDAMKYSRNIKSLDLIDNKLVEQQIIPFNVPLKLNSSLSILGLDAELDLYISKEPHTWFIADNSFREDYNSLINGKSNSLEFNQEDLSILHSKGLLAVNGTSIQLPSFNGRYSVRSDNVALISTTDECNLNCGHCVANANKNFLRAEELTFEEIKSTFKYLGQEVNPFGLDVEKKVFISGGEPLERGDLGDIALACYNEGLSTHICTNGLLIDSALLKKLRGKDIAFSVSFDGKEKNHEIVRGHGTFQPTLESIKLIHKEGFDVFLNTFLHQGNFEDVKYIVNLGAEIGVKGINFIRAIPRGRGKKMKFNRVPDKMLFREIYNLMKEDSTFYKILENENTFPILALSAVSGVKSLNCGLSRENYFFLDSIGNIFPCPGMRYDEFLVGNIRADDINSILERRKASSLLELKVDNFPSCSACDVMYFCGGDCRGSAYGNSNPKDIKSSVPYCLERKESLLELFRILGRDPHFFEDKSRWVIENAREETEKGN